LEGSIGFFDSGVGGISVLNEARGLLPHEDFLYYGDNLNAPYGEKPLEQIRALTQDGVDFLLKKGIKALVIACNTATSAHAETLRRELSIPIVAMEPALKPAHSLRKQGRVLVLATRATLALPKFRQLMALYGEGALPLVGEGLVELVESGCFSAKEADEAIRSLLAPFLRESIDAIVLGCTHYVFLRPRFEALFPGAAIVDGNAGTARRLQSVLTQNNALRPGGRGKTKLFSSGGEPFLRLMHSLLEEKANEVQHG
jgi:glutamate racemase